MNGSSKGTGSAERKCMAETYPNNRLWSRPWVDRLNRVSLSVSVRYTVWAARDFLPGRWVVPRKLFFVLCQRH